MRDAMNTPDFHGSSESNGIATVPNRQGNNSDREEIARRHAKLITMRSTAHFHDDMDAASQGTSTFGYELFDRYGRLKRDLLEHPIKRGSGMWQENISTALGQMLLIETLIVQKKWRRRGIATRIARLTLEKARGIAKVNTFVWPGQLLLMKVAQMYFGCTCGNCIGGFMSPRMRFALLKAAELHSSGQDFLEYKEYAMLCISDAYVWKWGGEFGPTCRLRRSFLCRRGVPSSKSNS